MTEKAMRKDTAIEYADQLLYERTGKHLSDLQSRILQQTWQGHTYGQVASSAGYSEGHVKDVAAQLWKALSEALGERITKGNLRSRLINRAKRTFKHAAPDTYESIASVVRPALPALSSQSHLTHPRLSHPQPTSPPPNPHFLGRLQALETLHTLSRTHRIIVIKGEGGIGKTTLAQQYAQQFDQVLELPMAKETANITPAESVVAEWLRQHFKEEPGGEFGVTLSRLKQHLHNAPSQRIGIFLDNLEPALDGNGQFVAAHRHYVELLRALSDSSANAARPARQAAGSAADSAADPAATETKTAQVTVVITSRDRLCEPGIKVHHYRLPGLSVEAWQQFFAANIGIPLDKAASQILAKMHRAYGGNAKAMEILSAAVAGDYEGDLNAYWQENGTDLLGTADLRNLLVSQVSRLQQLDADAYKVFCRLGCYRYQDQPKLKAAAITALMWDIDPYRHKQTINSLRDRSLLEFRKGDYWLHPVSRAEAIERLRRGEDWQQANASAAQYWSDRVTTLNTTEEGLKALEAYYHRMAAKDYSGAAKVLLKSRHNQWQQLLPLASSLYRMGLLQPVINAILQVLPHLTEQTLDRSELNNILGDVYWITGKVHSAIECQQQTLADTEKATLKQQTKPQPAYPNNQCDLTAYYLKMLTVDAHLSIGLYAIDLWELEQAKEQFERVIALAAGSAHQAWANKAKVGLALVQSYLGHTDRAAQLANSVYETFMAAEQPGQYAYFVQLLGRAFSSLGETEKATLLYERAIAFAEAGHYVQVKSQALTGLASVHRNQGDLVKALVLHQQAIEQSEIIGAKCDLAEAHFQAGLSKLAMTQTKKMEKIASTPAESPAADSIDKRPFSSADIETAIALFSDILAPRQIARVHHALEESPALKENPCILANCPD
ncbi:MAG: NB-ARC domain-containing protein [Phormidesmis sp.]